MLLATNVHSAVGWLAFMDNSADMEWPTVSVVMPIRNEVDFIGQNLREILNQDYSNLIEILVADGMSDDGTREVLAEFTDPRVKVIDNPARIVPTGLNEAIKQSTGEIVVRVDGHAVVAKDFVKQSVKALLDNKEAWASGGSLVQKANTVMGQAIAAAMSHRVGVGNALRTEPDFEGFGEGTNFPAMHRWVFDKVGYYDEALVRNQDDEFYFRLHQGGGKFFITPAIKYDYYVRENLSQLFRQYYQYSFWRIPVIRKHKQPTTLRQIIPSLFYLTMFVMLIVGLVTGKLWLALGLPLVYVAALMVAGIAKVPALGPAVALRMPLAIATLHAGYAWGMIHGFLCLAFGIDGWQRTNQRAVQLSR